MLAVFKNGVVDPPQELNSPAPVKTKPNHPGEVLKEFLSSHSGNAFSIGFVDNAIMAYALNNHFMISTVYTTCLLLTSNMDCQRVPMRPCSSLKPIEPFETGDHTPAHEVIQDLEGSFGFVIYDNKAGNIFVALGGDEAVKLFWGIAADGSVMISDNEHYIKAGCAKSFAPFPAGCMYHSERGLASFEHPMKKMQAMPRVDSEGVMCGANFKVDLYSKVKSMPRVGSEANWAI